MQRRLAFAVRRAAQEWVDDPERRRMVAERLRAVAVHIAAAELLDHVVEKAALHDVKEGRETSVAEILDRELNDTIEGLTTALISNPLVTVMVRKHDHHKLNQLKDSESDGDESSDPDDGFGLIGDSDDEDPSGDVRAEAVIDGAGTETSGRLAASPGLWRSVVEAHGARISKGNLGSVSALINWINVQGDATGSGRGRSRKVPRQPWPKRLPWPRAGARREQALMWPALWLSGETDLFPRPDGRDPNQRRRNRRIQVLQGQQRRVEQLMRETIERSEEADRG